MSVAVRRWVLVALVAVSFPVQATLLSRLGGLAAYDTVLDITWLTDANYCVTNPADPACVAHDPDGDGLMTWQDANDWAADLVFAGFEDWRLPYWSVSAGTNLSAFPCTGAGGADELGCRDSEMAYMFYYNIGGNLGDDLTGIHSLSGVTLTSVQPRYWTSQVLPGTTAEIAWEFIFESGQNSIEPFSRASPGWAVRDCDVGVFDCRTLASVPEPTTTALLALGLLGAAFSRRKH